MDDILTPMEKMDNAIKRANARAEAAEAENDRLREQVAALRAAVTRSRMMMDFNEFVGALRSAGWYSKADAQHRHIRVVWETLIARAEAAEAEVERLRQELATVAADVKLMLRTPHNHDWLASGDCPRCAIEQRLIANTTPARQRSSGGAVDDD